MKEIGVKSGPLGLKAVFNKDGKESNAFRPG